MATYWKVVCLLAVLSLLAPLVMMLLVDNGWLTYGVSLSSVLKRPVASLYNYGRYFTKNDVGNSSGVTGMMPKYEVHGTPEFVIVLCHGTSDDDESTKEFQRQLRQISVLLKSAVTLSTSRILKFNIISDSFRTYEEVTNITQSWPTLYRHRIVFGDYREVLYPPGTEKIKYMFRPCATERLFVAQAYKEKDAAVFLDTDTLFLMPPENLWFHISNFTSEQAIGIAPCLYNCGPFFKKFPTHGTSGLNAGVLVMNLTRIRSFEEGWTDIIVEIVKKYGKRLSLADQDILNIIFSNKTRATHLYDLSCEWNYRPKLCSMGGSRCKPAELVGAGLLHGAARTFVNGQEQKFEAIFKAWEQHKVDESLEVFINRLKATLGRQKKSRGCSRIKDIDQLFLRGLEDTLKWKDGSKG